MTHTDAQNNIGHLFKIDYPGSGLLHKWDILRSVDNEGVIEGEFISGHCSNFRLKNQVPEQLKKQRADLTDERCL